ncbi:MAG TPA: ATP-binding protein, partial [Nocardioidaceae bacterium]|nr:ATP-binding protein [Nocardioidaceae bacterium]
MSASLTFSLPAEPRAAALARSRVRAHLETVSPSMLDAVVVVISELVTNAVRYGGGSLEVRVLQASRVLRIEVFDAGQRLPQPATPNLESVGGRGLYVLGELASRWGTTLQGTGAGKVVWCEFDMAAGTEEAEPASLNGPDASESSPVLAAAENASPVAAVEAVTRELGRALKALSVSFLIVDVSGRGLVRLAHLPSGKDSADNVATPTDAIRWADQESAISLPFDGNAFEQAVRTQAVQVLPVGEPQTANHGSRSSWLVLAPVTERGESVGVLELRLPTRPSDGEVEQI